MDPLRDRGPPADFTAAKDEYLPMVRPIVSGNTTLSSGSEYTEAEGVTITPHLPSRAQALASPTPITGPVQVTPTAPTVRAGAQGRVENDVFETRSAVARSPLAAQRAVRLSDTRRAATALLAECDRHTAGPCIEIPRARTSSFQHVVDLQHERAVRTMARETTAGVIASLTGFGADKLVSTIAQRAGNFARNEVIAGATIVGTNVLSTQISDQISASRYGRMDTTGLEPSHDLPGAAHTAGSVAVGVLADVLGSAEDSTPFAGVAISAQVNSVVGTMEDGDERVRFQQAATAQDAARATAQADQRAHHGQGVASAHLAATGNGTIDWARFERDGDYAAGVRQGLREVNNDPDRVMYLYARPTRNTAE